MIFEIDESCLSALSSGNNDLIALFEGIALRRRRGRNILVAKREVFHSLSNFEFFSSVTKSVYNSLSNRMAEKKILLRSVKKHIRIVYGIKTVSNSGNATDERCVIEIDIGRCHGKDYSDCTLLLTENEEDASFYISIGRYYIQSNGLGNINIGFDIRNGGGATTPRVLKRIISEMDRLCLCIVDSDKTYLNAPHGATAQETEEIGIKYKNDFFEILELRTHEIENLIPLSILRKVVLRNHLNRQTINFLAFLKNVSESISPILFFDMKKGISNWHRDTDVKEEYANYWERFVRESGYYDERLDKDSFVDGFGRKILVYFKDYLSGSNGMDNRLQLNKIDDLYLINEWNRIGEIVYTWGCVGGRIVS